MAAEVEDGCRLEDIQSLALRQTWDNIHKDYVGVAPFGNSLSAGSTDISGADDADFARYSTTLLFSSMAPAILTHRDSIWIPKNGRDAGMSISGFEAGK